MSVDADAEKHRQAKRLFIRMWIVAWTLVFLAIGLSIAWVRKVQGEAAESNEALVIRSQTEREFEVLEQALRRFRDANRRLPSDLDELRANAASFERPPSDELFVDAWSRPYGFDPTGPRLVTLGRDGELGGRLLDADLEHALAAP